MPWLEPVMSHLDKHLEALRAFLLGMAETLSKLQQDTYTPKQLDFALMVIVQLSDTFSHTFL